MEQDFRNAMGNIEHSVTIIKEDMLNVTYEWQRPCVLFKPRLFRDGDAWCALLGEDLQSGVAGFGSSPAEAMTDFDKAWNEKLTTYEDTLEAECAMDKLS